MTFVQILDVIFTLFCATAGGMGMMHYLHETANESLGLNGLIRGFAYKLLIPQGITNVYLVALLWAVSLAFCWWINFYIAFGYTAFMLVACLFALYVTKK